jgi:hypothetical protein
VGFFVLPPILKTQLTKRLSAELGRQVTLEKLSLNPFALSGTLEKLDIKEADGKTTFFGWKRLYVDAGLLASIVGDWTLSSVELDGLHSRVVINADGSFNFSDILAKLMAPASPKAQKPAPTTLPPAVCLGWFKLTGASLDFTDNSRVAPFHTTVGPMHVSLEKFRMTGGRQALYQFEAVTEAGEKLSWKGGLLADPLSSTGVFAIENLILKKYAPYYQDLLRADLADGKLSLRGRYEASLAPNRRVMKLTQGAAQLRSLRVTERSSGSAAIEIPRLDIAGINADALTQKASVDSISVVGGHLAVRREKDGKINLLEMLPSSPAPAPVAAAASVPAAAAAIPVPAPAPALPDLTISEFSLQGFAVDVSDQTTPRPSQLSLGAIKMSAVNFGLLSKAAMPISLSFDWAPKGKVEVQGDVTINPALAVQLKTTVSDLDLLPLSAYLEQFVNACITQGSISTQLKTKATLSGGQLDATVSGNLVVDSFSLVDGKQMKDLAGFSRLELKGLKANTLPQLCLSLDEIVVAGPRARVSIASDGSINLAGLKKQEAAPAPIEIVTDQASVAAAPASVAPKVSIGKITITEGDFSFTDHSIQPAVKVALKPLSGSITGLSSDNPTRADVDLKGRVDALGLVSVTGKLDPLAARKSVDVKIEVRDVDLVPLSPYTGKYAGYELARGKLQADVTAKLDDRKVDVANVTVLNQFTFGGPTNSPDATSLPVRLGVALLKDLDGKIVIDLPVQGSLDDPNFKIGKMVWRVVFNLLTKAAVSPFSLIGSMFGGGGDELGYQQFSPGSASLLPDEIKKLDTMIKALTNRPGLSVDIEGGYDPATDTQALKRTALSERVRAMVWENRRAIDPSIASPEQISPAPDENDAVIRKLYAAKVARDLAQAAPAPVPVVTETPQPERRRSLYRRVADFFTSKPASSGETSAVAEKKEVSASGAGTQAAVPAGPTLAEMTERLVETMEVTDDNLSALAAARAQAVRDRLALVGKIAPERLFLTKSGAAGAKPDKGSRVSLALR